MFTVLSRGGRRASHAYICSSCIRSIDHRLPASTITSANAPFSTTAIRKDGESSAVEEHSATVTEDTQKRKDKKDNKPGKKVKSPSDKGGNGKTKAQKRMIERRKERLETLKAARPDASFKLLLKLYRAELEKEKLQGKGAKTADGKDEAAAELRQSLLEKDAPLGNETTLADLGEDVKVGKQKASKKSVKEDVPEKATVQKTSKKGKADPVKSTRTNSPKKGGKETQPTCKALDDAGASNSEAALEQKSKKKKKASVESKDGTGKDTEDQKFTIRRKTVKADPGWARHWVHSIATNREGGDKFKRAILLELIEKGNLTPDDLGPAVALLRNALRDEDSKSEFKSIRQGMQGVSSIAAAYSRTSKLRTQVPGKASSTHAQISKSNPGSSLPRTKKLTQAANVLKGTTKLEIMNIKAADLQLTPLDVGPLNVPKLSYGLERVLFNPGVYQLQDPRSRVFNFDPYLQKIMPVSEFDFSALKQYITSSRDTTLLGIAKEAKKKYTGSTSSMTSALGHFHFLLSQWRPINAALLSKDFPIEFNSFTLLQRGPSAVFLRYKDGVYAIDADKEFDTANILSSLGKSMEKLLTLPTNDFERYRKQNSDQISEEERNEEEAFHYTTMGDFLMRSQLDAHDPRLPGTGMFDLKTRAVVAIRMDTSKYEEGSGYEIRTRHGEWESYEREYYDMIRAAFLKYSLQVRMGRMDGIFVAFHNTERIFGFQYISLSEMDYALHGSHDTTIGDSEFKISVELLNRVLDRATAKYPEKSLRLFFETREADTPFMYIFAEPVEEKIIDEIQTSKKSEIEEFEARVLGLTHDEEQKRQEEWESLQSIVEQEMELDENGVERRLPVGGVWDEEAKKKVEDFINAAAQDDEDGDDADEGNEENEDEDEADKEDDYEEESGDEAEDEESETFEGEEEDQKRDIEAAEDVNADEHNKFASDEAESGETERAEQDDNEFEQDTTDSDPVTDQLATSEDSPVDFETTEGEEANEKRKQAEDLTEISANSTESPAISDEGNLSSNSEADTITSSALASSAPDSIGDEDHTQVDDESEVFAMTLTIRNKVNGKYVKRPKNLTSEDEWDVEYSLAEVENNERASKLYEAAKSRREKTLNRTKKADSKWNSEYVDRLMNMAKEGRQWRQTIQEEEESGPKKILVIPTIDTNGAAKEDQK